MSFMFSHPSPPPAPPPAPEPEKVVEKAKTQTKKKIRAGMAGRRTILTSPLGLQTQAPVARKTLLGG